MTGVLTVTLTDASGVAGEVLAVFACAMSGIGVLEAWSRHRHADWRRRRERQG